MSCTRSTVGNRKEKKATVCRTVNSKQTNCMMHPVRTLKCVSSNPKTGIFKEYFPQFLRRVKKRNLEEGISHGFLATCEVELRSEIQ